MKGKTVWVRDFHLNFHKLVVWDVGKRVIYMAEKAQFERLMHGLSAPTPIGFPKEDIFEKKPRMAKV